MSKSNRLRPLVRCLYMAIVGVTVLALAICLLACVAFGLHTLVAGSGTASIELATLCGASLVASYGTLAALVMEYFA